jgi:hypothetical protein
MRRWFAVVALVIACEPAPRHIRCSTTMVAGTAVSDCKTGTAVRRRYQAPYHPAPPPGPSNDAITRARWWCPPGRATCFRDRNECARQNEQGFAGCVPHAVAYCADRQCYGEMEVCVPNEVVGGPPRECVATE